jgi:drug/metabolite transporter (DMT)-like permease
MAAGQLVTASVLLVPLSLVADSPWGLAPTEVAIGSLFVVALFSTAVPVLLMFWLVRNAGATNASLLAFFMPIAAILLGVGLLGEQLSWTAIAGFGLIIFGAATPEDSARGSPAGRRLRRPSNVARQSRR